MLSENNDFGFDSIQKINFSKKFFKSQGHWPSGSEEEDF